MHSSFASALLWAPLVALAVNAAPLLHHPDGRLCGCSNTIDLKLPAVAKANTRHNDQALIQALLLAPTEKQRMSLLNQPGDNTFDFTNPPDDAIAKGQGRPRRRRAGRHLPRPDRQRRRHVGRLPRPLRLGEFPLDERDTMWRTRG